MIKRIFPSLLILICVLRWSGICRAHDNHLTGIKMIWNSDSLVVSVMTPVSRLKSADCDAAIRHRLKLRFNGQTFKPGKSNLIVDKANDIAMWQSRYTGPVESIEVVSRLYPEDEASRLILTVFRRGQIVQEAILDASHSSFAIGEHQQNVKPITVVGRFLREGVFHIFGGIDHICFVVGLLLLGGSLRQLLKTITAFTLAHSITLSLAATGILTLSPRLVEPLIALSIVAIAVGNLRVRGLDDRVKKADCRPFIAFGFGLIHGFGFAGALAEVGLPREALGLALVSFNLGVELGQGAIVIVTAPLMAFLAERSRVLHGYVIVFGSYAIAIAGAFWFFQRLLGF